VVPQDELDGLPTGRTQVGDRELKMAQQLIDSLAADWDPDRYHDTYREQVLQLIEKKAEGQEIVAPTEPEKPAPVIDLMAALEASLAAAKEGRKATAEDVAEDGEKAKAKPRKKAKAG
jgi:DNA end-binding protein Ku